jgi:hypothetical protein
MRLSEQSKAFFRRMLDNYLEKHPEKKQELEKNPEEKQETSTKSNG